jgi:hypothetical protein
VVIFTTIFVSAQLKSLLQKSPNPTQYVIKALKKILKPLVNLLISNGITYPLFNEIVKELFVDIAKTEFKLKGKQQTDSRINFLTGIHRKDVKRLRNRAVDEEISTAASLSALLISRWLGDPGYCDDQGNPVALPRLMKQGGDISFEGLVISINKDIRSRAILDEWLNMNIVYLDDNEYVCLNKNAFIPQQGFEEKAWFFGENCRDHIASAIDNLKGRAHPFLERAVYYDQLSVESVKELEKLSEKLGMEALLKINSHALDLQNADKLAKNAVNKMRMGLYFYHDADDDKTHQINEHKQD